MLLIISMKVLSLQRHSQTDPMLWPFKQPKVVSVWTVCSGWAGLERKETAGGRYYHVRTNTDSSVTANFFIFLLSSSIFILLFSAFRLCRLSVSLPSSGQTFPVVSDLCCHIFHLLLSSVQQAEQHLLYFPAPAAVVLHMQAVHITITFLHLQNDANVQLCTLFLFYSGF